MNITLILVDIESIDKYTIVFLQRHELLERSVNELKSNRTCQTKLFILWCIVEVQPANTSS